MVAKATVMQFHLFKDAKDPFCGLAAARGASWVFFLLLSLFCLPASGWAFQKRLKYANQRVTISFSEAARRSFDEKIFE